jgi:hypothetical protein
MLNSLIGLSLPQSTSSERIGTQSTILEWRIRKSCLSSDFPFLYRVRLYRAIHDAQPGEDIAPLSICFDIKMRRPSLTKYYKPRTPCVTAPWPEPPNPKHLKTFEFFPFLPYAVRKRIWLLALPGPRVIEIQYTNKQHEFRSPIPVLLHVSREARSIALTEYEITTASPLNNLDSALGHQYPTYVNFCLDTFCPIISFRSFITGEWKRFLRALPDCEKIQRLGLPRRCFQFPSAACIPLLLQYSSLKEVVIINDPYINDHPSIDGRDDQGWCLGPGEVLPTWAEFGKSGKEEILEGYSVQFMDKVREAWKAEHDRDLSFVYKGICWGGECWEMKAEGGERRCERKRRTAVRKIMGIPRRGVAGVMRLCM